MSRRPVGQRPLTLTEELERLEQSITLTLQEIDHNFSRAHRIVTSSILPVVEQYSNHSREVWEGSKFWKQFFEASANVSLSGYEEHQFAQDMDDQTRTEESQETSNSNLDSSGSCQTPTAEHVSNNSIQDIDLSNLSLSPSHSTPRQPRRTGNRGASSPYKSLQRDVSTDVKEDETYASAARDLSTPSKQTYSLVDDVAMTPEHSPEVVRDQMSFQKHHTMQKKQDPLLHTILDKNYRIQATPLASSTTTRRTARVLGTGSRKPIEAPLDSSPLAPPELHAEIFDSPIRREITQQLQKPRTPGVSVLKPGPSRDNATRPTPASIWDSDDELIDEATGLPFGASPPKTMQFHVPQSRLLKTPAREASKQIVDNILASAGVRYGAYGEDKSEELDIDLDLDDYEDGNMDESSPSVVRKAEGLDDETF